MTDRPYNIPVRLLRSKVAGRRPGDGSIRPLLEGEPFLNITDRVLCYLDAAGTLREMPLSLLGVLASAALTGSPTAPTPPGGDNTTRIATTAFVVAAVTNAITALQSGAPAALDTLRELADAMGDDPNFAGTVVTALGARLRVDADQALSPAQRARAIANLGIAASQAVSVDTSADDLSQVSYAAIASVLFTASSAAAFFAAQATLYNRHTAPVDVRARLQLFDVTNGGGMVAQGTLIAATAPTSMPFAAISPLLAYAALVVGRVYRVDLVAAKGTTNDGQVKVPNVGISGMLFPY